MADPTSNRPLRVAAREHHERVDPPATRGVSRLRAARDAVGMTQEALEEALFRAGVPGCVRSLRRWEATGTIPHYESTRQAICEALGTTPAALGWDDAGAIPAATTHKGTDPVRRREFIVTSGAAVAAAGGLGLAVMEILQDLDPEQVSAADPTVRALAATMAAEAIRDCDDHDPAILLQVVEGQLRWVSKLVVPQRHRAAITRSACHLSGVLSVVHADLDRHAEGMAYGIKARTLADSVGDPEARAWARAQQATVAQMAGLYPQAVELADDGLQVDPSGAHQARLFLRRGHSLARMGDVRGTRDAVARGLGAPQDTHAVDWSSMTVGPYWPAQATWEAARALAAAGDVKGARGYAGQALDVFDHKGIPAPIGRIEIATPLASQDPAAAAQLVTAAVDQMHLNAGGIRYGYLGVVSLREFVARTHDLDAPELREVRLLIHDSGLLTAA
jgi:hypothetical protein